MSTFKYTSEEAQRQGRIRTLQISIPMAFAVLVFLVGAFIWHPQLTASEFFRIFILLIGTALVVGFFSIRSAANSAASLEFNVESDRITRDQFNYRQVAILRSEVRQILEFPKEGLRIDSSDRITSIFVPRGMASYPQIRGILETWVPITPRRDRPYVGFIALGGAIIYAIMVMAKVTQFYALVLGGIAILVSLILGLVQDIHSSRNRR